MDKSSSRALIFDQQDKVYIVTHFYMNPANDGKWSTVGGRREELDKDDLDCLKREIVEEFGQETLDGLEVRHKVGEYKRKCEINNTDTVTHHFYFCRLKPGHSISPSKHQSEVKDGTFVTLEEVLEIERSNNFVLGCEAKFITQALDALI